MTCQKVIPYSNSPANSNSCAEEKCWKPPCVCHQWHFTISPVKPSTAYGPTENTSSCNSVKRSSTPTSKWKGRGLSTAKAIAGANLDTENIEVVGHSLGFVRVFPANRYSEEIAYLGPDVLAEEFDINTARNNIASNPSQTIGEALLDQSNLAGVGNEYRAEICFLMGVHPATQVGYVDVEKALKITRRLMWENRNSPIRVTTGVRRAGESTYVFGRNNKPCRRCRTPIVKAELGERIIWWCPRCQPLNS